MLTIHHSRDDYKWSSPGGLDYNTTLYEWNTGIYHYAFWNNVPTCDTKKVIYNIIHRNSCRVCNVYFCNYSSLCTNFYFENRNENIQHENTKLFLSMRYLDNTVTQKYFI